jgi:rfaE bifunctional protein nucleotidyltransferase chain/domain/rfaE bifunctional protein kinase chain/domain
VARPDLSAVSGLSPEVARALREAAPVVSVVGDLVLDGWWQGTTERMTREAPAPVVEVATRRYVPGGAANTAVNLAALGARVRLAGLVGDDEAGRRLTELLAGHGVDTSGVVRVRGLVTVAKNRVMVDDQVLIRLDDLGAAPAPPTALAQLAEAATAQATGADAELVCDYGTGALTGPVLDALVARPAAERPPLVVVDAHDLAPWARLRPDLVTPNAGEVAALVGLAVGDALPTDVRVERVADAADRVLAATGAQVVVVTLDHDGTMTLVREPGAAGAGAVADAGAGTGADAGAGPGTSAGADDPAGRAEARVRHRTWARRARERQASGAGDSFVAALTVGRAAGLPLTTSVDLAQAAADIVVQRFGTSVCSTDDLVGHLDRTGDLMLGVDDLVRRLDDERAAGRTVVLTNGCFDVLHRGHTTYLTQAKQLGDVLVVALNDDSSTRRLKGPGRPINDLADRAGVLSALSCVDYVTSFGTDTAVPLIRRLRPDLYAKGGDYTPQMLEETAAVVEGGGEVRILDYVSDHSTTGIVDRIRGAAP